MIAQKGGIILVNIFKSIIKMLLMCVLCIGILFAFAYFDVIGKVSNAWDSFFQSDLKKQDEVEYIKNPKDVAWNEVERMAKEKHVAPSLDPDFIEKYYPVKDQKAFRALVESGQKGVEKDLVAGTKKYRLAQALMDTQEISMITTDDLNRTAEQYNRALDKLAKEKDMSSEDFLNTYYDMSSSEFQTFVQQKAKDMYNANQDALKKLNESATDSSQSTESSTYHSLGNPSEEGTTSDSQESSESSASAENTEPSYGITIPTN